LARRALIGGNSLTPSGALAPKGVGLVLVPPGSITVARWVRIKTRQSTSNVQSTSPAGTKISHRDYYSIPASGPRSIHSPFHGLPNEIIVFALKFHLNSKNPRERVTCSKTCHRGLPTCLSIPFSLFSRGLAIRLSDSGSSGENTSFTLNFLVAHFHGQESPSYLHRGERCSI
jgi:hypothetical protein